MTGLFRLKVGGKNPHLNDGFISSYKLKNNSYQHTCINIQLGVTAGLYHPAIGWTTFYIQSILIGVCADGLLPVQWVGQWLCVFFWGFDDFEEGCLRHGPWLDRWRWGLFKTKHIILFIIDVPCIIGAPCKFMESGRFFGFGVHTAGLWSIF